MMFAQNRTRFISWWLRPGEAAGGRFAFVSETVGDGPATQIRPFLSLRQMRTVPQLSPPAAPLELLDDPFERIPEATAEMREQVIE